MAALAILAIGQLPNEAQAQRVISINDVTVPFEGNTGTDIATFTVTFSDTTNGMASALFSTVNGSASGGTQCGAGVDYVRVINGALQFTPTQRTQQIVITVCGDTRDENNETFSITLFSANGATIQDATGQATLVDDDNPPSLRATGVTVQEGAAGNIVNANFTVTMTGLSDLGAGATVATANGTATAGVCGAGGDYVAVNGSVTFPASPPNQTGNTATRQVTVQVCGDNLYEGQQQFQLRLTNPTNATLTQATANGTITDDETPPQLRITTPNVAITEPANSAARVNASFTVELAGTLFEGTVTVSYATAPITAEAGNCMAFPMPGAPPITKADYCSKSGTLSFAQAGLQTITVEVRGDVHVEPAETFRVTLASPQRATIIPGQGAGTATIAASP